MIKRRKWIIGLLIIVGIAIGIGALWMAARARVQQITFSHPTSTCCQLPNPAPFVAVTITTADSFQLSCWFAESQNGATILLLHGEGGDRLSMLPQAAQLVAEGFGVLSCDRRAHGASIGSSGSYGWRDLADVESLLAYLQTQPTSDPTKIGIWGISIGAQVAVRAAASYHALRAVVADGTVLATVADLPPLESPVSLPRYARDWLHQGLVDHLLARQMQIPIPQSLTDSLAQSDFPILFIAAGQTPHNNELRQAEWLTQQAGARATLWLIPDVAHGGGYAAHPTEYHQRVVDFFRQALGISNP